MNVTWLLSSLFSFLLENVFSKKRTEIPKWRSYDDYNINLLTGNPRGTNDMRRAPNPERGGNGGCPPVGAPLPPRWAPPHHPRAPRPLPAPTRLPPPLGRRRASRPRDSQHWGWSFPVNCTNLISPSYRYVISFAMFANSKGSLYIWHIIVSNYTDNIQNCVRAK